ncbi:MAG: sulfite exporter TauE/SafE family protein [Syntrophomonas sp.]
MLGQYLWLIPLGFAVGIFGTLIGVGGGVILVPVLLLLYPDKSPEAITGISLAVVFFNSLSGSAAYARMKRIDYKSGLRFALATVPGAILGALTTHYIPRQLFEGSFGLLMIAAAIFLMIRPEKSRSRSQEYPDYYTTSTIIDSQGTRYSFSYNSYIGILLSFLIGYISSLLGIGGGIIHVPVLVHILNFPTHIATATSHFVLVVTSLTGTVVHIASSQVLAGVALIITLSIGVILGAQFGAKLSTRFRDKSIMRLLAVTLGIVGLRILIMAFY